LYTYIPIYLEDETLERTLIYKIYKNLSPLLGCPIWAKIKKITLKSLQEKQIF